MTIAVDVQSWLILGQSHSILFLNVLSNCGSGSVLELEVDFKWRIRQHSVSLEHLQSVQSHYRFPYKVRVDLSMFGVEHFKEIGVWLARLSPFSEVVKHSVLVDILDSWVEDLHEPNRGQSS
jgi:hypothetical protein